MAGSVQASLSWSYGATGRDGGHRLSVLSTNFPCVKREYVGSHKDSGKGHHSMGWHEGHKENVACDDCDSEKRYGQELGSESQATILNPLPYIRSEMAVVHEPVVEAN